MVFHGKVNVLGLTVAFDPKAALPHLVVQMVHCTILGGRGWGHH